VARAVAGAYAGVAVGASTEAHISTREMTRDADPAETKERLPHLDSNQKPAENRRTLARVLCLPRVGLPDLVRQAPAAVYADAA